MARLLIIAVGHKLPAWADAACAEFRKRLGRSLRLELLELRPEPRRSGRSVEQIVSAESVRISAVVPTGARRIVLDERGEAMTTRELAAALQRWLGEGRDTAFVIGGADGLSAALKGSADAMLQLSAFTLPHALARVILLEQIYRAQSLLDNHPYHRE